MTVDLAATKLTRMNSSPSGADGVTQEPLVGGWLGFSLFTLVVLAVGYAALLAAFFGGGHDTLGRLCFTAGAVGTTGAFAFTARSASRQPIRRAGAVLAALTALLWLAQLREFLASPGWQF